MGVLSVDGKPIDEPQRLASLRWHVTRLDSFRQGLWNRAGVILSANALVTAAAAILISVGSRTGRGVVVAAALAMLAVLASVYEAMGVGGARHQWLGLYSDRPSPPAFLYAVTETMLDAKDYQGFQSALTAWTVPEKIEAATSEIWRLEVLHHRRVIQLLRSLRWLFAGLILLTLSAALAAIGS